MIEMASSIYGFPPDAMSFDALIQPLHDDIVGDMMWNCNWRNTSAWHGTNAFPISIPSPNLRFAPFTFAGGSNITLRLTCSSSERNAQSIGMTKLDTVVMVDVLLQVFS